MTRRNRVALCAMICAMFLTMCLVSLPENASAKKTATGTVRFTDSQGVDVSSYQIGETMYWQIEASGGKPGCYWACEVYDGDGNTIDNSVWGQTSWSTTKSYVLSEEDNPGEWKAWLFYKAPRSGNWRTMSTDTVDVYEAPEESWYGCTIPDGHYVNFYELDYLGLPGGHVDQYDDMSDYSYYMLGVSTETHAVGDSGMLSVSGYFRMWDDFTPDLEEGRRYVKVYALDEAATTVLAETVVLDHDDDPNVWEYRDNRILTGLTPGSTVSIGVGRYDAWEYNNWELMAEWAGVEVEQYTPPPADWIVMAYLNGDANDFTTQQAIHNLDEIEDAYSIPAVRTVAMIDITGNWPGATNSYARYYDFFGGVRTLVGDTGVEAHMGDDATLLAFMSWAHTYCGHDSETKWALVLNGHGQGYKGVCRDFSHSNDYLRLPELNSVLSSFESTIGKDIDVVGFDACIMQSAEVAYEIRDHVSVVVASEEVENGHDIDIGTGGWPYDTILTALALNPSADAPSFGTMIVDEYSEYWDDLTEYPHLTMSAIDTQYISYVAADARVLGYVLSTMYDRDDVMAVRLISEDFSPITETVDLVDFANQLDASPLIPDSHPLNDAIGDLITSVSYCVIAEWHGSSRPGASGIAVFFPTLIDNYNACQNEYDYDAIDFNSVDDRWHLFVKWALEVG